MPLSNRGFPVLATENQPGAGHVHIREARITKCAKNRALSRNPKMRKNSDVINDTDGIQLAGRQL